MSWIINVIVPVPIDKTFSYSSVRPIGLGTRVIVPFGKRTLVGVVFGNTQATEQADVNELKAIQQVIDDEAHYFEPERRELASWLAHYYQAPLGEVVKAFLPGGFQLKLTANDKNYVVMKALERLKIANTFQQLDDRKPTARHQLNSQQKSAIDELIVEFGKTEPSPVLLHGVTGSGKTEVYCHLIDHIIEQNGSNQVLLLVPEISLTPQATAIFESYYPDMVTVVHSGLTPKQRWERLEQMRLGVSRILIGPRSALFAVFQCRAAIIIDEEHDTSYKQQTLFCYQARDVATVMAKRERSLLVLGSATPSLESLQNCKRQRFKYVYLASRAGQGTMPTISLLAKKQRAVSKVSETDIEKKSDLDPHLIHSIEENLKAGLQTIILINRRGYSHFVYSTETNAPIACPNCTVSLTLHRKYFVLRCHYCDHKVSAKQLLTSHPDKFLLVGLGTQKLEEQLQNILPTARIGRLDSDVTASRKQLHTILDRFRKNEIDILIGTQMLSKGHDFPKVSLTIILEADQMLTAPDFRASERTFQLMSQASGRAGRGNIPGKVIIQTSQPNHYVIQHVLNHDFAGFAEEELKHRRIQRFPPFSRLVLIELSSKNPRTLDRYLEKIHPKLYQLARAHPEIVQIGPITPALEKVRSWYRSHILVNGQDATSVNKYTRFLHQQIATEATSKIKIHIDVDPISFM